MILGIDARFAVQSRRGIGNYTLNLIKNLAQIDCYNQYILYIDRADSENVLPKQKNFKIKRLRPANYLVWEQIALSMQAKKDGLDILHCTGNTGPIRLDKQIKLIITIHDVMFLINSSVLPESSSLYQRWGRTYRKINVPIVAKYAERIITVSCFSKADIKKHIPILKNAVIDVTHEAYAESFLPLNRNDARDKIKNKFGITENYILLLGANDPRKNTGFVIRKYIELKRDKRIKEKLIIVGLPDWRQTNFYNTIVQSNSTEDIIFTEFISEEDLVLFYNCASVFLYPSLYEGFGIPVLEAMACGVPVIASNITSIPEVVGDAAFLINPRNHSELETTLLALLNDPILRKNLIERGFEQIKKFSWQKMAKETLLVYQNVYEEKVV